MKYYFKKFASQHISSASDAYIWLLYFGYCSLMEVDQRGGDLWEILKKRIKDFTFNKRSVVKVQKCGSFLIRNMGTRTTTSTLSIPTSKIKLLQVKNFRGFGSEFNKDDKGVLFEFDANNTIFYGPNGSGKSSLCDALEYKLTGRVREAVKRNRNVEEYIKRIGASSKPSVNLSFADPKEDGDISDEKKIFYSQAFIEKNRIQEFSLFGSKDTGIKKEHILSILIGMDELSDLASSFVQPPAFKANLANFKRSTVQNKISSLNSLNVKNTTLKDLHEKRIADEKGKAEVLLSISEAEIADLQNELDRINNEIKAINIETAGLSGSDVIFHSLQNYQDTIQMIQSNLSAYDSTISDLEAAKNEVNFSNLYTAIRELQTVVKENCPACDTPLVNVTKNPFIKAEEELKKLGRIKELEDDIKKQRTTIESGLKSLEKLQNDLYFNTSVSLALNALIPDESKIKSKAPQYDLNQRHIIDTMIKCIEEEVPTLGAYFSELDIIFKKQSQKQAIVVANNDKISTLNTRKASVESIKLSWEDNQKELNGVIAALRAYTLTMGQLNSEKIIEDQYNDFIDVLISTYPTFYSTLQAFKDAEFKSKFGKLETEIAEFYAQINKNDSEHETIDMFRINNDDSDYKIEFQVKGSTLIEDASIKFSEGHLRSLGLSILLANAKINSLPFIIFDDVVNAIDSDHRANIIEMMVNDPYLKNTQKIISTHDRLYWEKYCLVNKKNNIHSYVLKSTDKGIVHYHYNLSFSEKIERALEHYDVRQALLYCRIWFETIAKQYCMENNIELKGKLKPNNINISIEPSLGSIYRVLTERLDGNKNLKVLHDEINFKGINQEHHSFDEYNFNFSHSRTSKEIKDIYDAVLGLDNDIEFICKYESKFKHLVEEYERGKTLPPSITASTPIEIKEKYLNKQNDRMKALVNYPETMRMLKFDSQIIESKTNAVKHILLRDVMEDIIGKLQSTAAGPSVN